MYNINRAKIKLLIELSQTVEEADAVIVDAGNRNIFEKWAFLRGMFDFALVGRHDDAHVTMERALEMDYFAALQTIINRKWEA